ncbi:MAG TPA: sialidase family protein, partial [Tepidisphaeraceae bacterium]|nr:sialidase family protein [Tepidisphaeraceae bacterium]
AADAAPPRDLQPVHASWQPREEKRGDLIIRVGPIRTIMRAARSPLPVRFDDGTILLSGGSKLGSQMIRSEDNGFSWRPQQTQVAHLNTLELDDGRLLVIDFAPKPVAGRAGEYTTKRWTSKDQGRTLDESRSPASLKLPADRFDPSRVYWFHGNLVQLADKSVVTVMQGEYLVDARQQWRTFLVRSTDAGETWNYVSMIADERGIAPIRARLERTGFVAYGSVEPTLADLGDGRLICITRTANDESKIPETQYSSPSETYHDLNNTITGDGIHKSMTTLPADKYYTLGPPNAPLIVMRSNDNGKTWSAPAVMAQARGCFPRTAVSSDGILALTYGGLGTPRWGNCIAFSLDDGRTWTDEIIFGPFLTTGYTGLFAIGPGKFIAFFDCTPPQPWTNDAAWWIGAVDIELKRAPPARATRRGTS